MKTNFDDPLTLEETVLALAEVYAMVIKAEAKNDIPLKELAMGFKEGSDQPILRLTTKGGRESNFGYLWAFSSGKELSDTMQFFSLALTDDGDDNEPDWDYNEVETTLKLVCLSIVAYQWSRHAAYQPVPISGEIIIFNDWEDGAIVNSLAIDLSDKPLDKILAHWCESKKSRQLVKALLKVKPSKNLLKGIANLGLDASINLLFPSSVTKVKKRSVKAKK